MIPLLIHAWSAYLIPIVQMVNFVHLQQILVLIVLLILTVQLVFVMLLHQLVLLVHPMLIVQMVMFVILLQDYVLAVLPHLIVQMVTYVMFHPILVLDVFLPQIVVQENNVILQIMYVSYAFLILTAQMANSVSPLRENVEKCVQILKIAKEILFVISIPHLSHVLLKPVSITMIVQEVYARLENVLLTLYLQALLNLMALAQSMQIVIQDSNVLVENADSLVLITLIVLTNLVVTPFATSPNLPEYHLTTVLEESA